MVTQKTKVLKQGNVFKMLTEKVSPQQGQNHYRLKAGEAQAKRTNYFAQILF